jgi:uncharacterized GH25 family protein/peroxiredoxin
MTIRTTASQNGQPLNEVQLKFQGRIGGKSFRKFLITTADGTATLEWPTGAKIDYLQFTARAPKFVPIQYNWRGEKSDVQLPSHVELRFDPGNEIGGVVRDESGRPIAGAKLELTMPLTWPHLEYWVFSAAGKTTDENGRWSWSEAPADCSSVNIQVKHPDYLPNGGSAVRSKESVFILKRGFEVAGRVVDPEGKPVAKANVALGFDRFGTSDPETKSGADGRFVLKGCTPGRSLVTVQAEGLSPTFQEVVVGQQEQNLEFHLEPGHTLKIRVVDVHGNPVAEARVATDTWRGHRSLMHDVRADAKGEIVWRSAPSDTILCDALKEGYMWVRHIPLRASDDFHVITLLPELAISGRVTDAATGEPIKSFHVRTGTVFSSSREMYWARDEGTSYENGQYSIRLHEPAAATALEVIAKGYAPARSRTFASSEGIQTFDFSLEPGKGPRGVVRLPDGSPAVGAEVALATAEIRATISMGRFNRGQNRAEIVKTDARGRFEFLPTDASAFAVFVLCESGYGTATADDLAKGTPITLQGWGRLKGRVLEGRKPDADRDVSYFAPAQNGLPFGNFAWNFGYTTKTDHEGRFEFDRVMPGRGSANRIVVTNFGRASQNAPGWYTPVEVQEGKTAEVTIGGTGRPVIGKIRLNEVADLALNWAYNQPATIVPLGQIQNGAAIAGTRYLGNILATGEFRIPDVPAGNYQLTVPVNNMPSPNTYWAGEIIGQAERKFTVPPILGGQSDTPLDLGEMTATLFHSLGPGETAPDFFAPRLGGGSVRMSDFRGKLVLASFWATWSGPSVAEFPHLKAIQARFGTNLRFAQLGLSCDGDIEAAKRFVEAQQGMSWFQASAGELNSRIPREYTIRAIPTTFLIAPDGRVLAKNLKGDKLEQAIAMALGDDKLFALATIGHPVRFPVLRATFAAEPRTFPSPPALLVLGQNSAGDAGRVLNGHLRLLSESGEELWSQGDLSMAQGAAAMHPAAIDRARNRIYVCEKGTKRITAFNLTGQKLWQIDQFPADTLAIDEKTGNLWASGGSRIDDGETVVFDLQGREVVAFPYRAVDMAYSSHDDAFWLVGTEILKLNRKGDVLFRKHVDNSWCPSVSPNPADGAVWIAERAQPGDTNHKNRLWQLNADGSVRHKFELGDYEISVVACAPKTGEAWIALPTATIRRITADGQPRASLPIDAKGISISPTHGEIWVATKDAILHLDPTGKVLAKSPFDQPSLQSWLQAF